MPGTKEFVMCTLKQFCSQMVKLPSLTQKILAFAVTLAAALAFASAATAQTFSLLHQFKAGRDGSNPYANVILDAKGNLYGTTTIDGTYGYGTVFVVSPAGKETILHSFTGTGGDGANPISPLIRDSAGNLYGTTVYGGNFGGACGALGCGTVFKIDRSGKETVLYQFTGSLGDGMYPQQGVVGDSDGNLYGTNFNGGAYGFGTVFRLGASGTETVLHSFNAFTGDGYYVLGGFLLRDSDGNLYGTTELGGSIGGGTVFKLDASGNETILYNFTFFTSGEGTEPYGSLIQDPAGNLYGVTNFGGDLSCFSGQGCGVVFKLDASNNETTLYDFAGSGGDGAIPGGGLVRDAGGNLYGTTNSGGSSYCGTVFKLDTSNTETILHSFSCADGRTPELGLVKDSKGNLYGTAEYGGAYGGGVVFKVTP
jgi:uncharacterized repeat protein (TIGR03803 family)